MKSDKELIDEFHIMSGHSISSIKSYRSVFNNYCDFHAMSLSELLAEAITEQENHVPENQLSIYNRILSFRNYLAENYIGSTVPNSVSKIKTFYRYNRVYLPFIPPLNSKSLTRNDIISFRDLPTKDEIRQALNFCDDNISLWILVILSSGMTRSEAKSITNEMFFTWTYEHHKKESFKEAMKCLSHKDNVVCTCSLVRQKTGKPYYTFLNPECVQKIAEVKLKQKDFNLNNPLLGYNINYANYKFKLLNDRLGFGKAGGFSRLRPHMLRKFHSTHLNQGSPYRKLGMDEIDCLHGRGKNRTRESYFKDNPEYLKLEYIKVMDNISLYHTYDWEVVNGKVKVISKPL
jgi:integrase